MSFSRSSKYLPRSRVYKKYAAVQRAELTLLVFLRVIGGFVIVPTKSIIAAQAVYVGNGMYAGPRTLR